jgi:chromate transporter
MTTPSSDAPLARPASLIDLFLAFNRLALQGFGGVLPVAQRELVERRRWLTRHEFVELLAVSQVLPGANIVNLSLMLGDRFFGLRGAFVALAGMLAAPLVIVLALAALYGEFAQIPVVGGALRGMGAVAAGLVISTALKLATTLRRNPMGMPFCLALAGTTVAGVAGLRWPLAWVVLGLGSIGIARAWKALDDKRPGDEPRGTHRSGDR